MRSRSLLICIVLAIATTGCNSSDSAARRGTQRTECDNPVPVDNRTGTILRTARLALSAAAERDSAELSDLATNDTIVRKMLRRERPFYRAASKHVQGFCIVSASSERVEIDLRFPYSRDGRSRTEHYQLVFVRRKTD